MDKSAEGKEWLNPPPAFRFSKILFKDTDDDETGGAGELITLK